MVLRKIYNYLKYIIYTVLNIKYNGKMKKIHILNDEKTVEKIINEKISIARFGDGEFRWILNSRDVPKFQKNSIKMGERLKEILKSNNNSVMICIPIILKEDKYFKMETKLFWKMIMNKYFYKLIPFLNSEQIYGNAQVSRFYIDYMNYKESTKKINNLRRIWDNRNVLLVEGEDTKFGVNNDLLTNLKSMRRIICPSKNAFDKYNQILDSIIKNYKKGDLILLSLGPTATILAYDLGIQGYQAIDIGHLDAEYEWYKLKAERRIRIKGKNILEVQEGENDTTNINLEKYNKEIIERV